MPDDRAPCSKDDCPNHAVVGFHYGVDRSIGDIEIQGGACLDHLEEILAAAQRQVLVMNALVLPATELERAWIELARAIRAQETGSPTLPIDEER